MIAAISDRLIDASRLGEFLLAAGLNITTVAILATLTYRRTRSRATHVFSLVVVNLVVFFATYIMTVAAVSINVGFGLFALFGILRFRTGTLPVQEMTYLFAGIAIGAFNALALSSLTLADALVADVVVVGALEILGGRWLSRQLQSHSIIYERVDLIHPARRVELVADLEQRTGLQICGVVVHSVNFLNDTAKITVRAQPTPEDRFLVRTALEDYGD